MGRLTVVYDKSGKCQLSGDAMKYFKLKTASLDIADDLEGRDIYEIARKLAELLLEQL